MTDAAHGQNLEEDLWSICTNGDSSPDNDQNLYTGGIRNMLRFISMESGIVKKGVLQYDAQGKLPFNSLDFEDSAGWKSLEQANTPPEIMKPIAENADSEACLQKLFNLGPGLRQ